MGLLSLLPSIIPKNREKIEIMALIDSKSKTNAIDLIYTAKLGLHVFKTKINTQKLDSLFIKI